MKSISLRRIAREFAPWLMALAAAFATAAHAQPDADTNDVVSFEIPAQELSSALIQFSDQTGIQVVTSGYDVVDRTTNGVSGSHSVNEALTILLEGTGLTFQRVGADTISLALPQSGAVAGQNTIGQRRPGIEEIIVTGQKREERIQDVPIAISAFTAKDLEAQKIEGGFDLLKGVPNVTFSKSNFSGYNFSIRGIGTKAVSATTDPGVAVSMNNTTLIVNRLFEQEYVDIERVEVLRGPQGTLYGRNATAGVINVITNKPELGVWDGMLKLEVGNYNARRLRGMFNMPIGDELALRGAYASTKRDGYGYNEFDGSDVDDRDLWTGRLTLGWQPTDKLRFNLLWERFEEDDNRARTSKQLCHTDPGPDFIGDLDASTIRAGNRASLSQGCLPDSLYDDGAYGMPNGGSLPYINGILAALTTYGTPPWDNSLPVGSPGGPPCADAATTDVFTILDLCNFDPYDSLNRSQSRDLRTINSQIKPVYEAESDIFELAVDIDLTDALLFSSQTVYATDRVYGAQDLNRFATVPGIFNDFTEGCTLNFFTFVCEPNDPDGPLAVNNLTPGGVLCDPQLGCSDTLVTQDISQAESTQFNQEFRLVSSFDGPLNFSLGANFTRFETMNDYYVFINTLTLIAQLSPFGVGALDELPAGCADEWTFGTCGTVYIDRNPLESIDGEGHNYFRSANPYELNSAGLFGELYWQATDSLKITAGLRMTWDQKVFTPVPSQLLLGDYRRGVLFLPTGLPPGAGPEECTSKLSCQLVGTAVDAKGSPSDPDIVQEWRTPTGRLGFDWKPDLRMSWLDESMIYGFYSRGYKGGGANPPLISAPAGLLLGTPDAPPTFEPEYVNAFEVGTKNTLFGGALMLNGNAFFYDYQGYQVSKIVNRSAANENFDAIVWGLELESVFAPTPDLLFNMTLGLLRTRIDDGETSIDIMDRTQGGNQSFTTADGRVYDEWMVVKPFVVQPSNCIAPVELVEASFNGGDTSDLARFCESGNISGLSYQDGIAGGDTIPGTGGLHFTPSTDAPNGGAGFDADLSGNELPNAPHMTFSLGGQYSFDLTRDWRATARLDYYWQDDSYARVYNTEFDKLRSWSNTNLSFWIEQPVWGLKLEAYVKNLFDESPITDAFVISDDTGLVTNVFTLDPRLIGLSVTKNF